MSIYRFSKGGRLFVQGTRENDARENAVSPSSTTATPVTDDLRAIYTKRRFSTEVLGRNSIEDIAERAWLRVSQAGLVLLSLLENAGVATRST